MLNDTFPFGLKVILMQIYKFPCSKEEEEDIKLAKENE